MEFLDISLMKDSSLLLPAIHSPFYWRILTKIKLYSGFNNPHKKSAWQEHSSLFMDSILCNGKMRVENQTKTPVCDSSLCPETSTRIAVQEFHLRTLYSLFEEVAGLCRLGGYNDFHNLKGFTSKRCQIIFFKMFVKKVFQLVNPFLANLHSTSSSKYS
jgi:hypothetical protein